MFKTIPFNYDAELKREIELRGFSHRTFENYRSHLRRLCEYYEKDLPDISIDEVKNYLTYLKAVLKRNPETINLCRKAFIFYRRCVMGEAIGAYMIPTHKVVHKLPDILSPDEILFLLNKCISVTYSHHLTKWGLLAQ